MYSRREWPSRGQVEASSRVTGGRQSCTAEHTGSTSCGREPWYPPPGRGCTDLPVQPWTACLPCLCTKLSLPLATASYLGLASLLSPAAWIRFSATITVQLVRGRAGHQDPPSHHWALLLPHSAADSNPKQNRLCTFPPSDSSALA